MKTAYKQLSEKYPELRCPDVLELCASAFEDCQQDVACVAGSSGLSFEPASDSLENDIEPVDPADQQGTEKPRKQKRLQMNGPGM